MKRGDLVKIFNEYDESNSHYFYNDFELRIHQAKIVRGNELMIFLGSEKIRHCYYAKVLHSSGEIGWVNIKHIQRISQ